MRYQIAVLAAAAALAACGSDHHEADKAEPARSSAAGSGAITVGGVNIPPITIPPIEVPDLSTIFSCDDGVPNEDRCDRDCPELTSYMRDACYVNCCTSDGRCGTRNTDARFASVLGECTAAGIVDDRCPSVMVGPVAFPGCCDAQNHCAAIVGTYCTSALTGSTGVPVRDCDAN